MINFAKCFEILTENSPFAWQIRLYEKFLTNQIPSACDIPTGLGKTSVIVIWLLALTTKLLENPQENNIPRRLVYVVDRRVIVDQATDEAQKILCRLKELKDSEDEDLRKIFSVLQKSSFLVESQNDVTSSERENANVIALSTLRGEYADNREWCLDPSRPAIIVGTIDMIGSRLLFSAYGGVGESYKALQAGLLGQDTLVVIDEAHLSPAFMQTLRAIHPFVNRKDKNTIKPFNIMSLSATLEKEDGDKPSETFVLEKDAPEDLTNEVAALRLNAEKKIEWKSFQVGEDVLKSKKAQQQLREIQAKEMASVAAQYKDLPVSVLVFGKTVDLVKKIKDELIASQDIDKNQVLLMVGGMRGYERDQLVGNPVFQMFAPKPNRPQQDKSYFLVATSCAEVGVNLDADFAVCDLTSADSFIQRLGRVNRFGESSSVVTIVFNDDLSLQTEQAIETLKTLRQSENGNSLNASPLALRQIKFDESLCYPPKPVCPPLDSARIDDWSMTSLKQNEFPRSLVSYWLRGVTKNTVPETSKYGQTQNRHGQNRARQKPRVRPRINSPRRSDD
jgi:CRISPR-associated endonuclease/helicase Cas3